jgi:hypothetical protein
MHQGWNYGGRAASSTEGSWRDALERICPMPAPMRTSEDWERFHHMDLNQMTRGQLRLEEDRTRLRLTMEDHPDEWFLVRVEAIQEALRHAR